MLPEAGVFEIAFLAAVALIVVGPKDLPVLLRKVGQFTAKMRGLAAEFRASFDEMARQSELDELRKEVDALRNGQFLSSTTAQIDSHVGEINQHLNTAYWDDAARADPVAISGPGDAGHAFIDPQTGLMASGFSEGDETAALPPPGARTPPLPTKAPRKRASAAPADGDGAPAPKPRTPRTRAVPKPAAPSSEADPLVVAPVRRRAAKAAAPVSPAAAGDEAAEA